jgi:hypothetical protein
VLIVGLLKYTDRIATWPPEIAGPSGGKTRHNLCRAKKLRFRGNHGLPVRNKDTIHERKGFEEATPEPAHLMASMGTSNPLLNLFST